MLPDLVRLNAPGGTLICSGLLSGQRSVWKTGLAEQDFHTVAEAEQESWAAVMFQKGENF